MWIGDDARPARMPGRDLAFVDVWPALRPDDAGYTVDTDINTMRLQVKSTPVRKRIDRVFARSAHWPHRDPAQELRAWLRPDGVDRLDQLVEIDRFRQISVKSSLEGVPAQLLHALVA